MLTDNTIQTSELEYIVTVLINRLYMIGMMHIILNECDITTLINMIALYVMCYDVCPCDGMDYIHIWNRHEVTYLNVRNVCICLWYFHR